MTEIIYIDAPENGAGRYRRKTYGTAERIVEEMTVAGPWLTARYLAHRLDVDVDLTRRTLHRMYHRGQVVKRARTAPLGRNHGGLRTNEWSLA